MWPTFRRVASMAAVALGAAGGAGAEELPITDAHLHYSENSRQDYAPAAVLALLRPGRRAARVRLEHARREHGTALRGRAGPHRSGAAPVSPAGRARHLAPGLPPSCRISSSGSRGPSTGGSGSSTSRGADARAPVVREVAELAARRRLFLHCHCDAEAVEILLGLAPGVRVLWAHAGMGSGPDEVGRLVSASKDLFVELALRSDVAPGGQLDPAWRDLFVQPSRPLHGGNRHLGRVAMGEPRRTSRRRPGPGSASFPRTWRAGWRPTTRSRSRAADPDPAGDVPGDATLSPFRGD